MSPALVTVGEPLVAFVAADAGSFESCNRWLSVVTGAEVNVAVSASRLGVPTGFVGAVGSDALGAMVLEELRRHDVHSVGVQQVDHTHTASLVRSIRHNGPAQVVYMRSGAAGEHLAVASEDVRWVREAQVLHTTGITLGRSDRSLRTFLSIAADFDGQLTLDVNYRSQLWTPDEARPTLQKVASMTHTVFADASEAQVLTGLDSEDPRELAESICCLGPSRCVMKLGPRGAAVYDSGLAEWTRYHGAPASMVIDPVGAGDAFVGGYLAAQLEGRSVADSLRWGHICGSMCVGSVGDTAGLPNRSDLALNLQDPSADISR